MNIDTNKYYNYRQKMMACGELNQNGYNTTPYGVFK